MTGLNVSSGLSAWSGLFDPKTKSYVGLIELDLRSGAQMKSLISVGSAGTLAASFPVNQPKLTGASSAGSVGTMTPTVT